MSEIPKSFSDSERSLLENAIARLRSGRALVATCDKNAWPEVRERAHDMFQDVQSLAEESGANRLYAQFIERLHRDRIFTGIHPDSIRLAIRLRIEIDYFVDAFWGRIHGD